MDIYTKKQWIVLGASTAVGFVALYFWLDYGFRTSIVIEMVLVAVAVGAQMRKVALSKSR